MDALAVRGRLVSLELEPHQTPLRMLAPLRQRFLPDVVFLLRLRDGEADAGLERIDLVVELRAGEDEPRLDSEHVERLEPERRHVPRPHHRVPERRRVLRMTEQLVAELASVPGP